MATITNVGIGITGTMPLLMHADNIDFADQMEDWKNNPDNKSKSKAGDDRTPPWRWIGCLNFDDADDGVITIPAEYVMRSIMGGAAEVVTGKGKKTFKSQSQSGLLCRELHWPLLVNGKSVSMASVNKVKKLKTFKEQTEAAKDLGFSLFVKRARVGMAKHVRVRPLFSQWSTSGNITIIDEQISIKILETILKIAGERKGLGDWRPSAPSPGPYGMFTATVSVLD
jgi:hypothetical protein